MVEILRKPGAVPPVDVNCQCGAVLRFQQSEGVFVPDSRDGDAYVFQCPCCFKDNWIAKSLIGR